jgi:hypothetical protein
MTTITLKINERTKMGKIILDLIKFCSSENKGVEVLYFPKKRQWKLSKKQKKEKPLKRLCLNLENSFINVSITTYK